MGRKHYRQEYKREGVQLVEVRGRPILKWELIWVWGVRP